MKLLHLGDLHLGRRLGEFELLEDQRFMLEQIVELAKAQSADAVVIAGDVYDRAVPSEGAVRLLDEFLRRLSDEQIAVFIISGNHDSDERLRFGSCLFASNRVFIAGKYEGELYKQEMKDAFGTINVYLLPFVKASLVQKYFPDEEIHTYEDAVRTVIRHAEIDAGARNVIVAHQFVAGMHAQPTLSGSEGIAVQTVGLVEQIGASVFDDFDYVALGHIHSPQRIGRETVRYCGSPLKYSLSEADGKKSIPVITLEEKGNVLVDLHEIWPLRDVRHLRGELSGLLKEECLRDTDDYIYVTLTDEVPVNDAMGIVRQFYPRTVRLDYDNSHTREIEKAGGSADVRQMTFPELMEEFYELIYGCEMSGEEMRVLREIAKEAGVTDEAN